MSDSVKYEIAWDGGSNDEEEQFKQLLSELEDLGCVVIQTK